MRHLIKSKRNGRFSTDHFEEETIIFGRMTTSLAILLVPLLWVHPQQSFGQDVGNFRLEIDMP